MGVEDHHLRHEWEKERKTTGMEERKMERETGVGERNGDWRKRDMSGRNKRDRERARESLREKDEKRGRSGRKKEKQEMEERDSHREGEGEIGVR